MSDPSPSREFSLSGSSWQLCPDPFNRGISEKWGERPPQGEPWIATVVPGTIQETLGPDFHGVAWYRLQVILPEHMCGLREDERLRIRFDCAASDARVWINGRFVGRHIGDYIPFEFEATEAMLSRGGEVDLVVRIDQLHAPRPAKGVITEHGHIGKGFHDVLSLQHAGLWGDVKVRRTGGISIRPGGLAVRTLPEDRSLTVELELDSAASGEFAPFHVIDPDGQTVAAGVMELAIGSTRAAQTIEITGELDAIAAPFRRLGATLPVDRDPSKDPPLRLWSPADPALYTLKLDLAPQDRPKECFETHTLRFGIRTVSLGGPRNRRILLNGEPIQLRGVLHWGHEPRHIAPMPTREQVRQEFAELKLRGFNCICLCMVYMPEYYYQIADEMGMLLWQEHPVWKAAMGDELLPEYQRLYAEYFRRDRSHPSIILVSGSCEHEMFNPQLAEWWWKTAEKELPHTLKQVQTAFFAWADPHRTDLYDEHTYDNSGRWVDYLPDVRAAIDSLPDPDKPFIMGETVLSNAWPDVAALRAEQARHRDQTFTGNRPGAVGAAAPASPWWITRGLNECEAVENQIAARWGEATLVRFRTQAHRHNLNLRKFQCELLRLDPDIAGWVMNHIRDVPACRCGFMDDVGVGESVGGGRWRYEPHELRGFLSDAGLLLSTPRHLRGYAGGQPLRAQLHAINFTGKAISQDVRATLLLAGRTVLEQTAGISAGPGELASSPLSLGIFSVDRPTRLTVRASSDGLHDNEWDLWLLPPTTPTAATKPDVQIHQAVPFLDAELEPEFEERKYSSGWGLVCRTWRARPQVPAELVPDASPWNPSASKVGSRPVILTHRLTPELVVHIQRGGRAILLGSRAAGGLDARTTMLWAGVPLVIESRDPAWPIQPGESACILDLLHRDLTSRYQRMTPTHDLGLADHVEPIIRFLHTHDSGIPGVFDAVFAARIGDGMLTVSSLDHYEDAGRFFLGRLIAFAGSGQIPAIELPMDRLTPLLAR